MSDDDEARASCAPDLWLWKVLQNERNREMAAKLEDTLRHFVHDPRHTSLRFPPRSAFHRRVCHAVASRFRLDHRLEALPSPPHALILVLLKTPSSRVPHTRLAQFAAAPPPPSASPPASFPAPATPSAPASASSVTSSSTPAAPASAPAPAAPAARFLKRPSNAALKPPRTSLLSSSSLSSAAAPALKSITEEDYRKARARIFKPNPSTNNININTATPPSTNHTPTPTPTPTPAPTPTINNNNSTNNSNNNKTSSSAPSQPSSRPANMPAKPPSSSVAKGPIAGSTGFERRRNRRQSSQSTQSATPQSVTTSTPLFANSDTTPSSYAPLPEPKHPDLQDPDFDRRYHKWALRHPTPHQPTPQPVALPVFSQLLYPYPVQTPHHHVHPSNIHMPPPPPPPPTSAPYQSIVQHPSNTLLFHHVAHTVRNHYDASANTHHHQRSPHFPAAAAAPPAVAGAAAVQPHQQQQQQQLHPRTFGVSEPLVVRSQPFAHRISTQRIGATAVAPSATPAYGLDSTVDFPPLQ
ncbi:R3H domain-containing protein 2 [Gracilariopsis chorda]|uniref:R3H domain-containing protein 2 n=1 Tax=Gracilariopsis chorda TaxID=448386 RepID=A0A2V3IN48_9FLOR|nr:R3H domain-containing protein 2 [Gracilariopsis chorda]|eukprot:PXF43505.1 R3H domain-containing protein 2 [Gracilariopsis chorda]